MVTKLYIENEELDQTGEESVEVHSSVLDISDITKNTGDYTKTFTVPASKNNNRLFKHWYDANIDNTFDARKKVEGEIHLDGIVFKVGKWRLIKVNVKKGKPSSYTINFFGNLVSLKDILGKDELTSLGGSVFDALEHEYNSSNVKTGLTSGLFNKDIIYNLLLNKQCYYNPISSDSGDGNIAFDGGSDGLRWNELKPSLRLIKIIEAIEENYDLTFSRDFFGTSEFTELYMWLDPDNEKPTGGETKIVDFNYNVPNAEPAKMNLTTNVGTYELQSTSLLTMTLDVTPEAGYEDVTYWVQMYVNDELYIEYPLQENVTGGSVTIVLQGAGTYEIYYNIRSIQEVKYTAELRQLKQGATQTGLQTNYNLVSEANIVATNENLIKVAEELPKMTIIDFLKGLFNMFKLVVVPQKDGTLYIDSLASFYSDGITYDVTKYIDFDNYDVNRGKILNEINLKFSEPQTILAAQFENTFKRGYGDSEVILREDPNDPTSKVLDGEKLEFILPFEQIVYERLPNLQTGEQTNIQYGAIIDEELEPIKPKPFIFYNLSFVDINNRIGFYDGTSKTSLNLAVNTPFHSLGDGGIYPYSLIFNAEFSTYSGEALVDNLYTNHYQDYVQSIFNIKKRNWVFKSVLPLHIITKLELNDTLYIKGNYYRIDKYSYNLLSGETTLTLINNFDESIGSPTPTQDSIYTDWESKVVTIQVGGLNNTTISYVDTGWGTSWASATSNNNNLSVDFDENNSGVLRNMIVRINGLSSYSDINLFQTTNIITADSTNITADNNIITVDNG
jgi:hypothetical protein